MTRPLRSAERFVAGLDRAVLRDVRVCYAPLLKIVARAATVDLAAVSAVIFSSGQGVALAPEGAGRRAFCVGEKTAEHAQARGWQVVMTAPTAENLVAKMLADRPTGPMVHLAGAHRRGDIAGRLTQAGIATSVVTLYDQNAVPLSAEAQRLLVGDTPVIAPLFSPRTAAQFAQQVVETRNVHVLCISAAVADALQGCGFAQLRVADEPTSDEMRRSVEMLLRRDSLA